MFHLHHYEGLCCNSRIFSILDHLQRCLQSCEPYYTSFWCLLTPFTDSTRDDTESELLSPVTIATNTCPLLILSPSGTPSGQHAPTRDSCRTLSRPCTPAPLIAPFLPHPGTVIASSWWLCAFTTTYEPVPCRDVSPLLFPVVLLTASLTLVFHGGLLFPTFIIVGSLDDGRLWL